MSSDATTERRRSSVRTMLVGVVLVVVILAAVAVAVAMDGPQQQGAQTAASGEAVEGLQTEAPPPDRSFALPPQTLQGFA
ncbi:MAG TPA: hypothetical protein VM307_07090, partial [Egibacteraceae bacterium]|nr:hypothetical protein [Egibacteraceae bacterium]